MYANEAMGTVVFLFFMVYVTCHKSLTALALALAYRVQTVKMLGSMGQDIPHVDNIIIANVAFTCLITIYTKCRSTYCTFLFFWCGTIVNYNIAIRNVIFQATIFVLFTLGTLIAEDNAMGQCVLVFFCTCS